MRLFLILTLATVTFAGQSIVLTNHAVANNSVPAAPSSGQWIREGYLDVIPSSISATNYLIHENTTGLLVWLIPGCGGICFQATSGSAKTVKGMLSKSTRSTGRPPARIV